MVTQKYDLTNWQQINYRKVNNLMSAEFLHDLYNRHDPTINSIRFRNTIVIKKHDEVRSYAPKVEWDNLVNWFSVKFLAGDIETFNNINNLINYDRKRLIDFIESMKSIDLTNLSNVDLAVLLIDSHYLPLGEIYKVNLVQIEKSLNYALVELLKAENIQIDQVNNIISAGIFSEVETFGVRAEKELLEKILEVNIYNNDKTINFSDFEKIYELNKYKYTAYGADIEEFDKFKSRVEDLFNLGSDLISKKLSEIESNKLLAIQIREETLSKFSHNELIVRYLDLMKRLGTRRDQNKELMGETNSIKENLLNRIAIVTGVAREELNNYLLIELCELLRFGNQIDKELIDKRKTLVVFHRSEYVDFDDSGIIELLEKKQSLELQGICASKGQCSGTVRIIRSAEDVKKMKRGDIMVAPGTDFDVINAMQMSGAIVTEEGGILSHASVVSRELGVPCVIGVKNCTNILNDGDIVNVDATIGLITIL